jgi:hypothetical protein
MFVLSEASEAELFENLAATHVSSLTQLVALRSKQQQRGTLALLSRDKPRIPGL